VGPTALVTIETPGRHLLAVDLELPLQLRGLKAGERASVLNLPGSRITVIDQISLTRGGESFGCDLFCPPRRSPFLDPCAC